MRDDARAVDPVRVPLTPMEWMTVLTASTVGGTLFVWPRHLVSAAGQDSLWAMGGLAIWMFGMGVLLTRPGFDIRHSVYLRILAGVGLAVTLGLDVGYLGLFSSMLQTFYYAKTPQWGLIFPIFVLVTWSGIFSFKNYSRLTQLWMPVLFGVGILIGLYGLFHGQWWRVALPNNQVVLAQIGRGIGVMGYMVTPLVPACLIALPHVRGSMRSGALGSIAGILFLLLFYYVLIMAAMGPDAIAALRWPLVYTLNTISVGTTFFISRIGVLAVLIWTGIVALTLMSHLQLTLAWLPPAWTKQTVPRLAMACGLVVAVVGISLAFSSPSAATRWILWVMNPVALGFQAMAVPSLIIWRIGRSHHRRTSPEWVEGK